MARLSIAHSVVNMLEFGRLIIMENSDYYG